MVIPPQLAGFSVLERVALQRARDLDLMMRANGIEALKATLAIEEPPGGGQQFRCELQIAYGLVTLRVLQTRVELGVEELRDPKLFETVDAGAFLPRRDVDHERETAAGAPCSGGARDTQTTPRGEGGST